jgi:hypothetical protein
MSNIHLFTGLGNQLSEVLSDAASIKGQGFQFIETTWLIAMARLMTCSACR